MVYKRQLTSQSDDITEGIVVDSEKEQLKKEIAELRKMIEELAKGKNKVVKTPVEERDIRPDSYIKVMSLCDRELNLSTKPRGQGKIFNFVKFGVVKKMFYSELLDIINNHQNFLEAGYFYILDEGKGAVKSLGLEELYERILTKEQIENVLNNTGEALSLFKSANEEQQKTITNMIFVKLRDGGIVDQNLVSEISRITTIDINAKVKEALQAMEFEKL